MHDARSSLLGTVLRCFCLHKLIVLFHKAGKRSRRNTGQTLVICWTTSLNHIFSVSAVYCGTAMQGREVKKGQLSWWNHRKWKIKIHLKKTALLSDSLRKMIQCVCYSQLMAHCTNKGIQIKSPCTDSELQNVRCNPLGGQSTLSLQTWSQNVLTASWWSAAVTQFTFLPLFAVHDHFP